MKTKTSLLFVILLAPCLVAPRLQGQGDSPVPSAENKQLEKWVGTWRYEGELKASPLGPAGKLSGTIQHKFSLNGFLVQGEWKEQSGMRGLELRAYDPASKRFRYYAFDSVGTISNGFETLSENECHGAFTRTDITGKTLKARTEQRFTVDGKSFSLKWELSENGGSWFPFLEAKFTKQD
jgi:hypothetical protein